MKLSIISTITACAISIAIAGHCQAQAPTAKSTAVKAKAKAKVEKPTIPVIRDKWAVLVGVGRYQDNQIGPLKYAGSNVLKLAKVLVDGNIGRFAPDHVLVVAQEKATKANLAKAIYEDWLTKKALPNDLIVLYLSARGAPTDLQNDWLIFPIDATYADKEKSGTSLSGLLGELRRRTQCKNIVCILDTSIASAVSDKYPRGFSELLQKLGSETQTTILTADDNLLRSHDSANGASSAFVEYLIEGLKAGAGTLPLETVAGFISESVAKEPDNNTHLTLSLPQHPALIVNQTNPELTKVPLGVIIKNGAFSAANVRMGHSIEKLEDTDPALAKVARDMAERPDPNDPQTKIKAALAKEQADTQKDEDDDNENDGSQVDFKPYMTAMKKAIQSKWATPKGMDQKTVVTVFSIYRDGRIADAEIVESSGSADIDKSALQALKDASPLAPLPKGAPKHVQLRYKFDYKVH
jgi:TonB family protein